MGEDAAVYLSETKLHNSKEHRIDSFVLNLYNKIIILNISVGPTKVLVNLNGALAYVKTA